MRTEDFVKILNSDFYTGVPDSLLKPFCDYLIEEYGISEKHIIAANEGNAAALAAGYHLSTGKVPVVYMQNSGIGNIINPVASLLNDKVYAIPCIFIVGWRGEPEVHDEPQHIYQGEVTIKLLEDMDINVYVISNETSVDEFSEIMNNCKSIIASGKSVAFVIKKGALEYDRSVNYGNNYSMKREEIIQCITDISGEDPIISTTGKASRELFEIREMNSQPHKYDFLTVGSMGHTSSIALGIAMNKPDKKIWCIDGDGSALMHMGSMAVIGSRKQNNLVHIVINNEAHETVGGMPTAASDIDLTEIAKACGYAEVKKVFNMDELKGALKEAKESKKLFFIEIKAAVGARKDLGRPTISAIENKKNFMQFLNS